MNLEEALVSFFTNTIPLPTCPKNLEARTIWWEQDGQYEYPWRIVSYDAGIAQGYPCGEPREIK